MVKILKIAFGLILLLIFVGCEEHPYRVLIDGKVSPTFKLKTFDTVYFIRILKSPAPESEIYPNEAGIWQIEQDKTVGLTRYPEIKYGLVPRGFLQKIPKDGSAPPALKEGEEYLFFAPSPANIKTIRFKIENGRSMILD
jgi:hypothetical protein